MSLKHKIKQTLQTHGPLTLLWKALRYPWLRVYHYVVLPACFYLGIPTPMRKPDRTFLEQQIFGYLASCANVQDILFAGVEIYTWHYPRLLPGQRLHTIDMNPRLARYGNPGLHTVGSVCTLDQYYSSQQFDVVMYNGLIGFGLNDPAEIQQALAQAYQVLKPGGLFILGWANTPETIFVDFEKLPAYSLFKPHAIPELSPDFRVEVSPFKRHTFDFMSKPVAD